jgi:pimeloyl-ACP methyl ester carboxylesterase
VVPESDHKGSTELVETGGIELFVRRFGNPALPMLVVVHGDPTWDHSYLLPAADLLADDVAALIRHYGAEQADVLGFSYGGGVAMRVVDQYPDMVRCLILASTSAYRGHEQEREASADYQSRAPLCPAVAWDDPALTGPDAPDGALSRAMAYAGAPFDIWHLDRLDDWHQVLAAVRFSSDWNAPHAAGQLRPAMPDNAEAILRKWARPVLLLQGSREMSFPVSLARRLHAALPASTLTEIPDAAHMAHFEQPAVLSVCGSAADQSATQRQLNQQGGG